jgi:hypothetical protein
VSARLIDESRAGRAGWPGRACCAGAPGPCEADPQVAARYQLAIMADVPERGSAEAADVPQAGGMPDAPRRDARARVSARGLRHLLDVDVPAMRQSVMWSSDARLTGGGAPAPSRSGRPTEDGHGPASGGRSTRPSGSWSAVGLSASVADSIQRRTRRGEAGDRRRGAEIAGRPGQPRRSVAGRQVL